jgi:hypothetical protein
MATRPLTLTCALLFCALTLNSADKSDKKVDLSKLPPPSSKTGVSYAADIKPIFEKSCFKCHGPEKQKAKLRLDSLEAALKGGEDGKILVPGKSAESLVVIAVARIGDEDDAMPPADKGDPLTKDQVALIRAWIDQGAK